MERYHLLVSLANKLGNVTASNMDLSGGLESENVVSNFGFFGSGMRVGGTQGNQCIDGQ